MGSAAAATPVANRPTYSVPLAQRRQSLQNGELGSVLKEPALHGAQRRSRLEKGDACIHCPAAQTDHGAQDELSGADVKRPKSQSTQTWSVVFVPFVRTRWPAAQRVHSVQRATFIAAENRPAGHGVHSRLLGGSVPANAQSAQGPK